MTMTQTDPTPTAQAQAPATFSFTDPKSGNSWVLPLSRRTPALAERMRWFLEQRAFKALQRGRAFMSGPDYAAGVDAWLQQCAVGRYHLDSVAFAQALAERVVQVEFAWLHFQQHTTDVTREMVGRMLDDPAKANELGELITRVNEDPRPEATAPAARA